MVRMPHMETLPVQPTRLVGRDAEVAACSEQLRSGAVRLLTLTGPPGVGKTRLALAVAAGMATGYPDGVFFVSLAPVSDPERAVSAIARAAGVSETRDQPVFDSIVDALRGSRSLLVLDNFEHLLTAAGMVAELLARCPSVVALATSRAPLRIRGEREYRVEPLDLPPPGYAIPAAPRIPGGSDDTSVTRYPAVALFVERARDVEPGFAVNDQNAAALAEICRRLDGLPLAIELAAARSRLLPPQTLLDQLEHRLSVLTAGPRDAPARHQTLRDAIAWSYDLLSVEEQALFRRLAVFVGGWTFAAAEALAGSLGGERGAVLPLLGALLDASLIRRDEAASEPRFTMFETIREFARERLAAAGEIEEMQERHAAFFVELAEEFEPRFMGFHTPLQIAMPAGPVDLEAAARNWRAGMIAAMRRMGEDEGNVRAALAWAAQRGDADTELRLIAALWNFWWQRGSLGEIQHRLSEALDRADGAAEPPLMRALFVSGISHLMFGRYAEAQDHFMRAFALAERLGDERRAGRILGFWSIAEWWLGDIERAQELVAEELRWAEELDDEWCRVQVTGLTGLFELSFGDSERGLRLIGEVLVKVREWGSFFECSTLLASRAKYVLKAGDWQRAGADCAESLAICRLFNDPWVVAWNLVTLAGVALARDDGEAAARLLGAADEMLSRIGAVLFPHWHDDQLQFTAVARAVMGEPAFTTAWNEGQAMSLEEAIDAGLAVASGVRLRTPQVPPTIPVHPAGLSDREVVVLRLLAAGRSNREIAEALTISVNTVFHHVTSILTKTGTANRTEAAAYAHRTGLAS